MISTIMAKRAESWLGDAELRVFHLGGERCQKEMRRICATLSEGATCYRGTYYCEDCDVAVEVVLRAHPDIPYELYQSSERKTNDK